MFYFVAILAVIFLFCMRFKRIFAIINYYKKNTHATWRFVCMNSLWMWSFGLSVGTVCALFFPRLLLAFFCHGSMGFSCKREVGKSFVPGAPYWMRSFQVDDAATWSTRAFECLLITIFEEVLNVGDLISSKIHTSRKFRQNCDKLFEKWNNERFEERR